MCEPLAQPLVLQFVQFLVHYCQDDCGFVRSFQHRGHLHLLLGEATRIGSEPAAEQPEEKVLKQRYKLLEGGRHQIIGYIKLRSSEKYFLVYPRASCQVPTRELPAFPDY